MVKHLSFYITSQPIFFSNKNITIIISEFLNRNFVLVCNLLMILWLCVPHALFAGQNSDAIYFVVMKMGVRVVMFSSEGA